MKQLKLLILIFSLVLCIPLAFFVLRSYQGLEQEEVATLRYFAETFFDEMEQSLAALVQREEGLHLRAESLRERCRGPPQRIQGALELLDGRAVRVVDVLQPDLHPHAHDVPLHEGVPKLLPTPGTHFLKSPDTITR